MKKPGKTMNNHEKLFKTKQKQQKPDTSCVFSYCRDNPKNTQKGGDQKEGTIFIDGYPLISIDDIH